MNADWEHLRVFARIGEGKPWWKQRDGKVVIDPFISFVSGDECLDCSDILYQQVHCYVKGMSMQK